MQAALLALFVRELAAPFLLILLVCSIWERRKREVAGWVIGLVAYAAYFAVHIYAVGQVTGPMDKAFAGEWVEFGGVRFVLATAQINGVFWALPISVTAFVLPLSLLGLAAWPAKAGALALGSVAVYLTIFTIIGMPANTYWGLIYTPMLAVGLSWAPMAVFEVFRIALGRTSMIEDGRKITL